MVRSCRLLLLTLLMLPTAGKANATVVDLDHHLNVEGIGVVGTPVALQLAAGTWTVDPVGPAEGGVHIAFSAWGANTGACVEGPTCDGLNGHGYGHYYRVYVDGVLTLDIADVFDGTFHATPEAALAAASPATLVLTSPATVEFYIPTGDPLWDNRGGISLRVSNDATATGPWATVGSRMLPPTPNPFNPRTRLVCTTDAPGEIAMVVFDARGRRVRRFGLGHRDAGRHTVDWDGTDDRGRPAGSGSYLVRLAVGGVPAGSVRAVMVR